MSIHKEQDPPRTWRTALAVVPVATVAWLGIGTGAALAAPNGNAAPAAAPAANGNANANGNGGVGNGNGNGNDKHQDPAPVTDPGAATGTPDATAPAAASATTSGGTAGTSGSVDQPQPISKADANSGGANGQCTGGAYCSTRNGSPSGNGNGNGNGKAVGKPCAGCVGKADNKNPKGQMPGGSDHNKGYECDGNNGIGKTNPAHTGCTPPAPPSCDPPKVLVNGVCTTTTTDGCPAGEHLSNGSCVPDPDCVPTTANHNCQPTTPCVAPAHAGPNGTCVLGEKKTRKPSGTPSKTPTSVLGEKVTRLPFTGVEAAWLAEGGLGAVALGTLLVVTGGRRRRRQA